MDGSSEGSCAGGVPTASCPDEGGVYDSALKDAGITTLRAKAASERSHVL